MSKASALPSRRRITGGVPGIAGQAMADPFKRDTGITLELVAGSPNAITSRVQASSTPCA